MAVGEPVALTRQASAQGAQDTGLADAGFADEERGLARLDGLDEVVDDGLSG